MISTQTGLHVRKPALDVQATPLVWSRIPEFSIYSNGSSICIPFYEHYLNNVAKSVRDECRTANPALADRLDDFIRQEATHARYHAEFNRRFLDDGNPALDRIVKELVADLQKMRKERSLAYNMAFCAGFENTATYSALYLFQHCDDLFEGADPNGANLFLWHVAEEFEHRSVCHDAFMAISGRYLTRIAALVHSFRHIGSYFDRAADVILKQYQAGLTEPERRESQRQHRALMRRQQRFILPRLGTLLNPRFDPARFTVPPKIEHALKHFSGPAPVTRHFNETWAAQGAA
ncbi:metal-dependent hydrolase [Croceicoccus mobilis]|uniref:Metal-dependent hydrolase n=1 Tax=Croceicoccus mobilis TaxID=1703339 RepID=A0A916ZAN4_9SPHN|nr:metal-dependent hydrolase [Croceicoccus mobilis]GGD84648.1 hypothetical protein GCM10010990_38360 [Croceicoccus mobilis]